MAISACRLQVFLETDKRFEDEDTFVMIASDKPLKKADVVAKLTINSQFQKDYTYKRLIVIMNGDFKITGKIDWANVDTEEQFQIVYKAAISRGAIPVYGVICDRVNVKKSTS